MMGGLLFWGEKNQEIKKTKNKKGKKKKKRKN